MVTKDTIIMDVLRMDKGTSKFFEYRNALLGMPCIKRRNNRGSMQGAWCGCRWNG